MSDNQPPTGPRDPESGGAQGPRPGWYPPNAPQGPPPQGPPPQGWPQGPQGPAPGYPQGPPTGWGQSQGPSQAWPSGNQQQGWAPPGGGQQPWGPPQPSSGGGKKLALIIGGIVIAVALIVGAVVVGVTQLGGDDSDSSKQSSGSKETATDGSGDSGSTTSTVMSAAGSDELRKKLQGAGWTCYDSLDDPIIKRCFYWKPDGEDQAVTGTVSLRYEGKDKIGTIDVRAESASTAQTAVLQNVAKAAGDALLDGNGAKVQQIQKSGSSQGTEVEGARVFGGDGSFSIYAPNTTYPDSKPPAFPALSDTQAAMQKQGLSCATKSGTVNCQGDKGGLRLSAIAALRNGAVSGGWSLSVSSGVDGGKVQDGARVGADLLKAAGLTDDAGAAFIAAHPQSGQKGDFATRAVSIISSVSGQFYSMNISIGDIR